jgi:DnaK suppressor protein
VRNGVGLTSALSFFEAELCELNADVSPKWWHAMVFRRGLQIVFPVVAKGFLEERKVNQRQLKSFEELLMGRRQELLSDAGRTVSGMTESEHKENFPEPADRAALESDRNAMLRIRDRERKLIAKIDEALERIADGTYGVCGECGEQIGVERLKARPVTTLCIDCKADQEAEEKKQKGRD